MAGVERIHLQQFEVAGLAAPAGLLCRQLEQSSNNPGAPGEQYPSFQFVLHNPALLVRVLDVQHKLKSQLQPGQLIPRLTAMDVPWLHNQLSDTALQLLLQNKTSTQLFHQLYWQQTRHCAHLARALAHKLAYLDISGAEACAALLPAGMLVLEQQHQSRWCELYQQCAGQNLLLNAERQMLGVDHIEAGVRLLESWQLEQNCVDALRYQATAAQLVLDATPLVRICWLANQLTSRDPAAVAVAMEAAEQLFELSQIEIQQVVAQAKAAFNTECASWSPGQSKPISLPLSDEQHKRFAQEVQEELFQLQRQLLGETALAALEHLDTATDEQLQAVLARALQQAGVDPRFIILGAQQQQSALTVIASNKTANLPADLALRLLPGRSVLATNILGNTMAVFDRDHPQLTVIDRQLLDLLGGNVVLIEPVSTPQGCAVLLLSSASAYPQRKLLRAFVKRKLVAWLQQEVSRKEPPVELLLYKQRVSEAIHEANNPLAIIKNYLQLLQLKLGDNNAGSELKHIDEEIDRVAAILAGLRQHGSTPEASMELDLNALVRSMHKMLQLAYTGAQQLSIELDLSEDPALVMARTDALKQILTNLVKNAAEALQPCGNIRISTRRNVIVNEKRYMLLRITDNGPGIAPARLSSLFTPGTTTKGGTHTGTGLAIVKRLVEEMQGEINCQSDNKGTVFSILLPQR